MKESTSKQGLNAAAVGKGGDGAVLGEALKLALPLHGHARHDVPALAEPGLVAVALAPVSLLRVGAKL